MKAVILSIGDELILGQTVDSNSAWLSAQLSDRGVIPLYHKTVADDIQATVNAMKEACEVADIVISTGGLGPTADDLTRQSMAALINRPLDLHPPSLDRIKAFFKTLNRDMPVSNRIQAMVPRGSDVLDNEWGTAPGIKVKMGKAVLFAFPGVPREMMKMAERYVLPLFEHGVGHALASEALHTFGAGESTVAEKLGDIMRRDRNPLVGTTVSGGIVTIRIRSEAPTPLLAQKKLIQTVSEVKTRLGILFFGRGSETLSDKVAELCSETRTTLAVAESCTGGLVSKILTDIPGSSTWFAGGWVTYSNEMKTHELGVSASVIENEGAVSEAVVCAMAKGALEKSGASMAVALTGIAGPEGGSPEKPVGTVWIGLATRNDGECLVLAQKFQFPGSRHMIRDLAAKTAINWLRLELAKCQQARILGETGK